MIADEPKQWLPHASAPLTEWERCIVKVLEKYVRVSVADGRSIEELRREIVLRSSEPEFMERLFKLAISSDHVSILARDC